MSPALDCPACAAPLAAVSWNTPDFVECPVCHKTVRALVFPALFRPVEAVLTGESLQEPGEASCFFHPEKRAMVACARCGRFLCSLCDLPVNDEHICPSCLEAGRTRGKIQGLDVRRPRHDLIALWFSLLPMILFWPTMITAPITIYLCARHWNSPRGLTQKSRAAFVAALLLASAQIVFWIMFWIGVFPLFFNGRVHFGVQTK
jgi:hypothetical protein